MKTCPFCAEEIQDAAIVCKHCGRDLTPPPPQLAATTTDAKKPTRRWPVFLVIGAIVFGLFYLWADSPASISEDAARRAIDGLERDRVLTDRQCNPVKGNFSPMAWRQLTEHERENLMGAMARLCMGHGDWLNVDLYNVNTNLPLAHYDGSTVTSR